LIANTKFLKMAKCNSRNKQQWKTERNKIRIVAQAAYFITESVFLNILICSSQ